MGFYCLSYGKDQLVRFTVGHYRYYTCGQRSVFKSKSKKMMNQIKGFANSYCYPQI